MQRKTNIEYILSDWSTEGSDDPRDRAFRPAKEGVALSQAPIAREAPDSRDFLERQISNLPRSHEPCHRPIRIHICMQGPAPSRPSPSRPDRGAQDRLRRTGVPLLPRASAAPRPQRSADSHLRAGAQRRDTSRACMVRGAALTRRSARFVSGCVP